MRTRTKLVLAGSVLLVLALGSVGIAAAQAATSPGAPARQGARVYGVVEVVVGDSLTLATPIGQVTILTDVNTRFRIPGVEQPSLSDLDVGDAVGATGWWEEDGDTFHAFGVGRLEADRSLPLAGRLSDVGDDALTVETERGPAAIRVDSETTYRVRDVEEAGLDDLSVGLKIVAQGTLDLDGNLLAQTVAVPWVGPRPVRLQGEVLAIEGDTFTVRVVRDRQPDRQLTVLTDEMTEFHVPGVDDATIADLQVGDRIAGEGVVEDDGAGSGQPEGRATLVIVLPEQVARLTGEVVAVEGATLKLDTPGGTVDVLTDVDTVLRVPGVEEPTLDDVEIGDRATATGEWEDETTFNAIAVGIHGDRRTGQRGTVRGRAIRVETDQLVLGTLHGPVTVLVDGETQYRVPGADDASLDDVAPGAMVGARGTWNEDGTLQATGVAVLDGR